MMRGLLLVVFCAWLAPAQAADPRYDVRLSLDPATRLIDVRMRVTLPAGYEQRFAPGFAVQTLHIDGQAMDPAAQSWPVPRGRAVDIVYRATLPTLEGARTGRGLVAFADPEGSLLPLAGWHGLADEAFTYDVTVDLPAPQRAVVPGRLVEEREADGRSIARFVFDKPARELIVFAGPYVVGETMHRGLRLRTYFPKETAPELGARYREQVARHLDAYAASIGPYPHDEFHVVASPLPVGLGFATLTYVSRQILPLPFMLERSLAHEVLHAWWGLAVAVDYERGNWAEALTTFMADYALAEAAGGTAAQEMRRRWLSDFAVLPPQQDRPVTTFVSRDHAASQVIGYNKGAMLFLMLRDEIGAPAFDAGIKRFWRERQFTRAGWNELRTAFEAESQRPLEAFFRQWLERNGAPRLALRGAERSATGEVAFTLQQPAPPYRLSVPVLVDTAAGTERHTVRLDATEQAYRLRPEARAAALRIDPEHRLFRRLPPEEVAPIIRSLVVAPEAATVAVGSAGADGARAIAGRLLEAGVRVRSLDEALAAKAPLLLVGTTAEVSAALARAALPARPAQLAAGGTARVWAARHGDVPMLVVEGEDAAALSAAGNVIRHYGTSSYLVFDGSRVTERGVWPPTARPLEATFAD